MNKFYFWTIISLNVLNVFSEELEKNKVILTKEQLEQKKSNLIANFPKHINNIFTDSDPIANWDNNKFNNKQLKWSELMIQIYNSLVEPGPKDSPKNSNHLYMMAKNKLPKEYPTHGPRKALFQQIFSIKPRNLIDY